jgi:hypothetical protein
MSSEEWRDKKYSFFQNRECESFPCHQTDDVENFSAIARFTRWARPAAATLHIRRRA